MEPPFDAVSSFDNDRIRRALVSSIYVPSLYRDLIGVLEHLSYRAARGCRSPEIAEDVFDYERPHYSIYPHPTRGATIGRLCTPVNEPSYVIDFLDGLNDADNPGGLLAARLRFRVVNAARSAYRTAARRRVLIDTWNPPSVSPSRAQASACSEEELNWLRARLAILRDFERNVIRLYDVQHLTYQQIADVVGATYAQVQKARLHALEQMNEEAVKAGLTLSR